MSWCHPLSTTVQLAFPFQSARDSLGETGHTKDSPAGFCTASNCRTYLGPLRQRGSSTSSALALGRRSGRVALNLVWSGLAGVAQDEFTGASAYELSHHNHRRRR